MADNLDQALRDLDQLDRALRQAASDGFVKGTATLAELAKGSDTYGDQTGATRAGTVAYAVTPYHDGSGDYAAAQAAAEEANPGHGAQESADATPDTDTFVAVLTVATDYAWALHLANGGDHAFIDPAMEAGAGQVGAAIGQAITEVLGA